MGNKILMLLISIALLLMGNKIIKLEKQIKNIENLLNTKETKEGVKYIEADNQCIRIGEENE